MNTSNPAKPLRAAVIGCGAIAYEHLPYLAASPRVSLSGVCDLSPAMARAAGNRFGTPAYSDFAELLGKATPDVVHILTPPQSHMALVRQALAAGCHVICEKPMTGSAEDTATLLGEAQAAGRVLQESRNYLFNDTIIQLRAMIAAGELGTVVECDLLLSLDFLAGPFGDTNLSGQAVALKGGAVIDFLPHLAYLFLIMTGAKAIKGARGILTNRSENPRAGCDFLDALIEADGARGRVRIATDHQPDMFRLYLRGTRATVEVDLYAPYFRIDGPPNVGKRSFLGQMANGWRLAKAGGTNFRNKVMQHGTYHGLPRMLDAIYAAVQHGEPPPFSAADMIATAELTDRLLELECTP